MFSSQKYKQSSRNTVAYARRSSDEKDKQIRSIPDQIQDVTKCYQNLPSEEQTTPLQVMHETGSAYKPNNRPVFEEILQKAERGEIARIIVYDPTRLSRNPQDSGRLIQLLADGKIPEIVTANGARYRSKDTTQIFQLMLESGTSWKYSADSGTKVSDAMTKKIERGEVIGLAPLGYKNMGTKGNTWAEINEEIAPIIRQLFELAAAGGHSIEQLVKIAKAQGLRTRPRTNRVTGEVAAPRPLPKNSVANMLKNPFYKGSVRLVKKGIQNDVAKHHALVPVEMWNRVQMQLARRRTSGPRPKDAALSELFLMRGVVKCGECGHNLCFYRVKKGRYIYAECKNPARCGVCIRQNLLLVQLNERLDTLRIDANTEGFMRTELQAVHKRRIGKEKTQRQALEARYQRVQDQLGDLFMQRSEAERRGLLDAVESRLCTLQMERNEVQDALNKLHDEGTEWINSVIQSFELVKLAQEAIQYGSPAIRQAVLNALASNYAVKDGKLVWDLRSPFREVAPNADCTEWGERWYDVRTEIRETHTMMKSAFSLLQQQVYA